MEHLIKRIAKKATIEKLESLDFETLLYKVIAALNSMNLGFTHLNFEKMEDINKLKIWPLELLQCVEESKHFSTEDEYFVYCNDMISSYSKEKADKIIRIQINDIAKALDKNGIDLNILIS